MSSDEPLVLLNALLGLARPVEGWPAALQQLGYEHLWVDLEGEEGGLPEVLLLSPRGENLLLVSPHPGGWPRASLLRRYAALRLEDVLAELPREQVRERPRSLNVVLLGRAADAETLKRALAPRAHAFPLLILSPEALRLLYNSFTPSEVNVTFALGVPLDQALAPRELLPLYPGSSDRELAESLVPLLVDYMARGRQEFTAREAARELTPGWEALPGHRQQSLEERVELALQVAAARELGDYLGRGGEAWKLRLSLRGKEPAERQQILGHVRRQAEALYLRLEDGMQLILPEPED